MRAVISCGGTAGHINPAIAIADIIRHNESRAEILFTGTPQGMENELVARAGYRLAPIRAYGLSPHPVALARALWYAAVSPYAAKTILRDFAPDVVIGTGGYACYPTLRAAAALGIPTVLHESNAVPGKAILRLQNRVDRILLNFEEARAFFGNRAGITVTGNPLRRGFVNADPAAARRRLGVRPDQPLILSFGGSLGAPAVNRAALYLMKALCDTGAVFYHSGGKRYYDECMKEAGDLDLQRCRILPYIDNMPEVMAAADLVLCRAGAMTISELALAGKPAILIPSPYVAANHQYKNARALADAGAAFLIEENEAGSPKTADIARRLLQDRALRQKTSEAIARFAHPNADRLILRAIREACSEARRKI